MKAKALTLAFAALTAAAVATPAQAQEATTITAEVVDLVCYLNMGMKGEAHRECAQTCADNGLALGFLGSDGQIYLAAGQGMPAAPANDQLRPHAEHTVEVKGTLFERSGSRSIVIESISMKK